MRAVLRFLGLQLVRVFGSTIQESTSGLNLGKAFLLVWRGKIYLIGYEGPPVAPVFLPQEQVTYWHSQIGFRTMHEVDFPRVDQVAEG